MVEPSEKPLMDSSPLFFFSAVLPAGSQDFIVAFQEPPAAVTVEVQLPIPGRPHSDGAQGGKKGDLPCSFGLFRFL
jgi:hypothetical protein